MAASLSKAWIVLIELGFTLYVDSILSLKQSFPKIAVSFPASQCCLCRFHLAHLLVIGVCSLSFSQSQCHSVEFCAKIPESTHFALAIGLASAKLWKSIEERSMI